VADPAEEAEPTEQSAQKDADDAPGEGDSVPDGQFVQDDAPAEE
jgi:hypothetical protein